MFKSACGRSDGPADKGSEFDMDSIKQADDFFFIWLRVVIKEPNRLSTSNDRSSSPSSTTTPQS